MSKHCVRFAISAGWLAVALLATCPLVASAQTSSAAAGSDTTAAAGQDASAQSLAQLKQNPVSGLRQLIVDGTVSPDVPGTDGTLGSYSLQLVWPFPINDDWKLISYSILPVLHLPGAPGQDSVTGLGNTLLNFYVAPTKAENFVWGLGPAVVLPTHSDPELGSNRVGLGPSLILFYQKGKGSAGVVLQNVWSLGGSRADKYNAFGAQYIFNYNLPHGWYLYSNSTITADWEADSDNRWTVPVGGGVGRVFNIGKQSVSAAFQIFSNVEKPDNAPDWSVNFQFALLFP